VTQDTFLRKVVVLNRNHTKKGVAMQSTTVSLTVSLPRVPFLFSPTSLYAHLLTLTDQRDPRGVRYPLAALLTIATLAKLAEQDAPQDIADWARLRAPTLADLFGLDRPTMPHPTTWNRVFGAAIDPQQFARVVADFLTVATAMRGTRKRRRGRVAICLDGKTLRGTIPAGVTRGVHLLAAYLPEQGIVLVEVVVEGKENEIVTARAVLALIDVQGCVVTGDAGALWAGSRNAGSRDRFGAREAIISGVSRRIRGHCTTRSPPCSRRRRCPRCPMISPPRPVWTPRTGGMSSDG
jgi:hypothetical protein